MPSFKQERANRFAAGNLLPYSLAEFRQALPVSWVPALGSLLGVPRMLRSALGTAPCAARAVRC
jgi:hypothetical protein